MRDDPHSCRYFTDARDHWWNADYLELVARRLGLRAAKRVLDVGTGQGHFARAWAPWLAPDAHVVGVDREARSLDVARKQTPDARFRYQVGDARALPFADDAFDAVVCQTLLIHAHDPSAVFAELVRVVRPGGLVLVAEPNNFGGLQRLAARGPDADLATDIAAMRFHRHVIRGKHALGEGWNDLGARLPSLFVELDEVVYYANDRPFVLAPPYATQAEKSAIADMRRDADERVYGWPRDEACRYYLAGGGDERTFDEDYDSLLRMQDDELRRVDAGEWLELTGQAFFVAAGRKRARELRRSHDGPDR